jgi:hypothetical protein
MLTFTPPRLPSGQTARPRGCMVWRAWYCRYSGCSRVRWRRPPPPPAWPLGVIYSALFAGVVLLLKKKKVLCSKESGTVTHAETAQVGLTQHAERASRPAAQLGDRTHPATAAAAVAQSVGLGGRGGSSRWRSPDEGKEIK